MNVSSRTFQVGLVVVLIVSVSHLNFHGLAEAKQDIENSADAWSGIAQEAGRLSRAPKIDFISDAATWKLVWSSWCPDETAPKIDFEKHLVLFATMPGPNQVDFDPKITKPGEIQFLASGTLAGGPGFGFRFRLIDRKGIKTVNGIPIEGSGYVNVTLIGKLSMERNAMNGEIIRATVTARGMTWNLDFERRPWLTDRLKTLDGKMVYASGALEKTRDGMADSGAVICVSTLVGNPSW